MTITTDGGPTGPAINPELLALLVCPVDKEALRLDGQSLVCTACGRVYPIEDGIPNMLVLDDEPAD
jgi:uncharacterized protein YbaR (Trm112 family)